MDRHMKEAFRHFGMAVAGEGCRASDLWTTVASSTTVALVSKCNS
jgi:hypothetical protein